MSCSIRQHICYQYGAFKKFKEWWEKTKKPEVARKAKMSIIERLKENKVEADRRNEESSQYISRRNPEPER